MQEWHKRVKLFEGDAARQIRTYTEAVTSVDPAQAVGKPHSLWCAFRPTHMCFQSWRWHQCPASRAAVDACALLSSQCCTALRQLLDVYQECVPACCV